VEIHWAGRIKGNEGRRSGEKKGVKTEEVEKWGNWPKTKDHSAQKEWVYKIYRNNWKGQVARRGTKQKAKKIRTA